MPAADKNSSNLVTTNVNLSTNLLIDALIGGSKWGGDAGTGATVYYSFPASNNPLYWSNIYYNINDPLSETYTGFSAFNATQQAAASSALQSWANVANINIVRVAETVSTVGDIRFAFTSNSTVMAADNYAYAYMPNNTAFGGDIWLNPIAPVSTGNNFSLGANGYQTLVHEIGHALGLRHSFANPNVPGDISLPVDKEYFKYSVMSYSDTATTFDNGFSGYYPTGPMLLDIQAIQYLYGANMSYHTGNDTYVFNGTTKYYQTIWDAGGIDTIQYNSTTGGVIRLTAGEFSELGAPFLVGGGTQYSYENVGIAYNVVIENAIGGSGGDQIYGNQYNNILDGRQGTDALVGGAGDDTYVVDFNIVTIIITQATITDSIFEYGNQGSDTIYLRGSFANTVTATLSIDYSYYSQIENLNASATGVTKLNLDGNALSNIITGNNANNLINGGTGADTLIGGLGDDTYIVDDAGDIVTELLNSGIDSVESSITYSLIDTDGTGIAAFYGGNVENLKLTGTENINATGNALNNILIGNSGNNNIDGLAGNDSLNGGDGSDTLNGGAGADTLDGGTGADSLNGGDGADIYFVDDINDIVTEDSALAAGGIDLVNSKAASFTLSANVENLTLLTVSTIDLIQNNINATGNTLANTIIGNSGNNIVDGGAGIDNLTGGLGSDTYIVDLTAVGLLQDTITEGVSVNDTADTIQLRGTSTNIIASTFILGANIEILDAGQTGNSKLNLTGNALNNSLTGNAAANILDGGLGADALAGGAGDDTYLVDIVASGVGTLATASLQDSISESLNEGIDTLKLRGTAVLINASTLTVGDNIENIDASLTGTTKLNLTGNALNNNFTGNAAANIIDGGDGNDTLDGGAAIDMLIGGAGDDTYIVDSLAEANLINDFSGSNTLNIGLTYTLANGGSFNNLNLTGATAINGTGNSLGNTLTGNVAANNLAGLDGDDTINAGAGADTLNGGLGADSMTGGDGNDVYFIDNALDQVIETNSIVAIGGIDIVQSSISFDLSTHGANVENLTLLTVSTIDLIQNNISVTGNGLANTIVGNIGDNIIDGGLGIDALAGGLGSDTYIVDLTAAGLLQDTVTEAVSAADNSDKIQLRGNSTNTIVSTLILGANIEILDASQTGYSKLNLTGNALNNSLTGNDADNILDGGLGADALTGGKGNDTYLVDSFGDSVTEQLNEGTDLVKISLAVAGALYTLGDNIENATLTNAVAFNLTANALDNVLTGNAAVNTLVGLDGNDSLDGGAGNDNLAGGLGNDTLNGGLGADTLDGGDGDDTYVVDIATDAISIDTSGNDTVKSSVTYSIATRSDLENITLTGLVAISATGNDLANTFTGNDAANTIDGGAGADAMNGGKGADAYLVDDLGDTVAEDFTLAQGGGIDLVKSSVSFTLGTNLDNLTLLTESIDPLTLALNNIDGTGNDLANIIVGNGGDNVLIGNAGNDSLTGNAGEDYLDGGLGVDIMVGGTGNDIYIVDNINDVVIETALPTEDHMVLFDTIRSSVSFTLSNNVEYLVLTGNDNINGTANAAGGSYITGNNANNIFKGGAGGSTFIGMGGDDTYFTTLGTAVYSDGINPSKNIAYIKDNIVEAVNGGIDTLILNGSIAIAERTLISLNFYGYPTNSPPGYLIYNNYNTQNIENLDISQTGLSKVDLEGNDDANKLTGNAAANTINGGNGNDTLDGGAGLDTLIGGAGDDVYIVDSLAEVNLVNDFAGNNTLNIGLTYTLANAGSFTNLNLTGAAAINGTGNAVNNIITGNDAANTLDGNAGDDTMDGGKGNDTYVVDSIGDVVKEQFNNAQGGGIDLVKSSVDFDLSNNPDRANIDNITLTGIAIYATGNALANIITGNAGSNVLDGKEGIDTLIGGLGNDSYYVDLTAAGLLQDTVVEVVSLTDVFDAILLRGSSTNTIVSTLTLGANIEILDASQTGYSKLNLTGNALNNSLTGNDADNILDGGLGADALTGGKGNDTYLVDSFGDSATEQLNEGTDLVKISLAVAGALYTLGDNIENATLTNAVAFNLSGNALDNILIGNAASNTIDGGTGADTLIGGLGNDIYVVDNIGDIAIELLNSGIDTVQASITYSLIDTDGAGANGGNIENLTLTGADNINGTGNTFNNILIGNSGINTLNGGAGADTLDGGIGADSLNGGDGNDVYYVDDINDIVTEDNALATGGIDLVNSKAANFTLSANVENLTLLTVSTIDLIQNNINATGNALANTIIGNSGDNVVDGGAGDDTLVGNAGNDFLNGGIGNDNMNGGIGDDTYVVDSNLDVVTESIAKLAAGAIGIDGGFDIVQASITYTLGLNIDALLLTGSANLNGTGNTLDNYLIGNDGNNILSGLAGFDILDGGLGNDSLLGGLGNDTLYGGMGDDTLDGGAGVDSLIGGDGNDTYRLDLFAITSGLITTIGFEDLPQPDSSGNDTVEFRGVINNTSYRDFYIAGSTVENFDFTVTGTTKINIIGDEFANKFIGNLANNLIVGDLGNDTIIGGAGNDTLDGGADDDQMIGGDGSDTYVVDSINDQVIENNINVITGGIDLVISSIDYVLGANLENLNLTGAAVSAVGNALNNIIIGDDQNNILNGSAGNDTLIGGLGDDSLVGGDGNDVLTGGLGSDMLTGGLGADRFVFNSIAESNPFLSEIITDFSHIQLDKIDLSAIDANSNTAINDAFTFATSFTGVLGQVVYDANTFSILADTNGDSAADFFINIWGVSALVASDFVL